MRLNVSTLATGCLTVLLGTMSMPTFLCASEGGSAAAQTPATTPAAVPAAPAVDDPVNLVRAARKGDLEKVQGYLDKGIKPDDPRDANGNKAIGAAAHDSHLEVVQLLVKAGADPKADILKYCSYNSDGVVAAYLISIGAGQKKSELIAHETPLIFYTVKPKFRLLLVQKTATDPNQRFKGETILINCIKMGMLEVVQALIERGADIQMKSDAGDLPIDVAKSVGEKYPAVLQVMQDALDGKIKKLDTTTAAAAVPATPGATETHEGFSAGASKPAAPAKATGETPPVARREGEREGR